MSGTSNYQRGNRLAAARRYREAIEAFEAHAQAAASERANAFERVGYCWEHINSLSRPVSTHPATNLVFERSSEAAIAAYRRALECDADHPRALKSLARLLPATSAERLAILERACAVAPDTISLLAAGDYYRTTLKSLEKARMFYTRAVENSPRDRTAYLKLIELCKRLDRQAEAVEWSSKLKALAGAT